MKPYYDEGGVTIYHGDCREVLPSIERADHAITDPPYENEAHTLQRRVKRGGAMAAEALSFEPITDALREFAAEHIARVTARWVLTFCQVEAAPLWRSVYERAGLIYKRTCVWVKPDGMPQYSGDRPGMGYETFVAMHRRGRSRWNAGGRHGVWTANKNENHGNAAPHPTTKPSKLMESIVADFTDPGELVLDPFCGSGSTLVAARKSGRRAIGIEIEERYCEIAAKRLAQAALPLWG